MSSDSNGFQLQSGATHFNVVVQTNSPVEKNTYYPTFEFKANDPVAFFNDGVRIDVGLNTAPYYRMRHNLYYVPSGFEFNVYEDGSEIRNGAIATVELTVTRVPTWTLNNLFVSNGYIAPATPVFELGADNVDITKGSGSELNSTNYDLNFGSALPIDSTNYDLNFAPSADTITKSYSWDFAAAFYGTAFAVDLTTDRTVVNNDLPVSSHVTGFHVLSVITDDELSTNDTTITLSQRVRDTNLNFRFDVVDPSGNTTDMLFQPIVVESEVVTGVDFAPLPVHPENSNSSEFNLTSIRSTTDLNLRTQIRAANLYGKNLRYDVLICSDDTNPALNSGNHNFDSKADFRDKECGELSISFYHGSGVEYEFDRAIIIQNINMVHGQVLAADLSNQINLYGNAYSGQHLFSIFSTYPSANLTASASHGSNFDIDVYTVSIMRDVDVRYGIQVKELELETYLAAELVNDAYSGAAGFIEILTEPVLQVQDALHGTFSDSDLTIYPSIELVGVAYAGSDTLTDIVVSAVMQVHYETGLSVGAELGVKKSAGLGFFENYHGLDSTVDLAYTPTLDSGAYHGALSSATLSHAATFNADGYHGGYADLELTPNLPKEFDFTITHGSHGLFDLSMQKALFPRAQHGVSVAVELDDRPAIEVGINARHGVSAIIDTLEETEFNLFAHHGATMVDFNLQVTVNIPVDIIHGASSELDEIKRGASLDMDATHGHNGFLSNFVVPVGESIIANAYAGQLFSSVLRAPVHAIIDLYPIVGSQTLYDGLGGVGGINHCYLSSRDLDPAFGDNVTRLGYDPLGITDQLIVRFDDIGDDAWTTCNSGGTRFDVAFQTNPRLEADAYTGESVHTFFPLEVMALIGNDVPLERLYQWEYWAVFERAVFELEEIKYQTTGAVWDHPDDVVGFYEAYFSAELTATAFAPMYHGAYVEADLVVPVYSWKIAQAPIETGAYAYVDLEPVIYIRFCKGYIVPNGNGVVFEFDREDDDGCAIFLGAGGAGMEDFEVQTIQSMAANNFNGQHARASLTIDQYWTLYARHGHHVVGRIYEEPEMELILSFGSGVWAEFYEPPIEGAGGHTMFIDGLIIPGPAVRWETETQCLPNEFQPITPDGDIDVEALKPDVNGVDQYPVVPVEGKPYLANLLANCITYDTSIE